MEDQPINAGLVSNLQNEFVDASVTSSLKPRPPWFSLILYLSVVTLISLVIFALLWAFLVRFEENENALILSTAASGLFLGIALVAREIVWRRAETHHLLRYNEKFQSSFFPNKKIKPKKFTLEENEAVLRFIEKKSTEAFSIDSTAAKHFEAFSASQKYLDFIASELASVRPGSPRLQAFKKGQERIGKLHKKHLLTWAAAETQSLTKQAAAQATTRGKIETATRVSSVLQSALLIYPHETALIDSLAAVKEFIVSTRVAHWVELAERSVFKKRYRQAIDRYQDALFYLERESSATENPEHAIVLAQLNNEIEGLRIKLAKRKKQVKN